MQLEYASSVITSGTETLVEWDSENVDTNDFWESGDPEVLSVAAGDYKLILVLSGWTGGTGEVDVLIETDEGSPTEILNETITLSEAFGDDRYLLADLNSLDGTPLRVKITPASLAFQIGRVQQVFGELTSRISDAAGTIVCDLPVTFFKDAGVDFEWLDDPPPGAAVAVPQASTSTGVTVDDDPSSTGGFSFDDSSEVLPPEGTEVLLTQIDTWDNTANSNTRGQTRGITPVTLELTLTLIKVG